MSGEPQLAVSGLEKRFDEEFRLSAVDLAVEADEIVALLGPSGCGKTTTLRCIAGVETPDAGRITIADDLVEGDGRSKPPEKRDVGMVYQNYAIWPHKTVYENVVFPLEHATHSFSRGQYERRVEEMLSLVQIDHLKESPATDLSGGQQQRTALARSLVHDPDLLLLDEPLSNLDKKLRKTMRYELQRLQHELGISILYVTHDQEEAFYLADRVLVMDEGEIVERGTPRELYRRPRSEFTRGFIGSYNQFEGAIVLDDDGTDLVRTELVDFPLREADYVSDGTDGGGVQCFIRPGDVSVGQAGMRGAGRFEVVGTVVAEGILGDKYEITVRFDDRPLDLVAHTEDYRELTRGDDVSLYVPPNAIQVYED
jgi:ABC-type Fe3+/spermidine/putrescine transport system ATPase subunit